MIKIKILCEKITPLKSEKSILKDKNSDILKGSIKEKNSRKSAAKKASKKAKFTPMKTETISDGSTKK